jgi:hypothetical protein
MKTHVLLLLGLVLAVLGVIAILSREPASPLTTHGNFEGRFEPSLPITQSRESAGVADVGSIRDRAPVELAAR